MPNKKEYYPRANALKRMRRRPVGTWSQFVAIEFGRDEPKIEELKDALARVKRSAEGVWRLAALMDNLAAYKAPRYTDTGRTTGIRAFLIQDPLLKTKYKTLMRYKHLAEKIRDAAGIVPIPYSDDTPIYNLLWALSPTLPSDIDEYLDEQVKAYQSLRKLYLSFAGMNFKQIEKRIDEHERHEATT